MPNNAPENAIYYGTVFHKRFAPKPHCLEYKIFQILLDIDNIAGAFQDLKMLQFNRFGLFSFYERDYGPIQHQSGNLGQRIRDLLRDNGIECADYKIMLLTMPRVLGFVFNPISIYFVIAADEAIKFLIYEVNNTFGDRHSYIVNCGFNGGLARHITNKHLHVSPFMASENMEYVFRLSKPTETLHYSILLKQKQPAIKYLFASFHGQKRPLNDANLWKMFFMVPLVTLKVVAAIHFEALKIIAKGIFLKPKPPTPKDGASVNMGQRVSLNKNYAGRSK